MSFLGSGFVLAALWLAPWPLGTRAQLTVHSDGVSGHAPQVSPHPNIAIERLDLPDVRYRIVDYVGTVHVCGPLLVPANYAQQEAATFADIQNDSLTFRLIAQRLGIQDATKFSDEQKISIYREYARLRAIIIKKLDNGYEFRVRVIDSTHPVKGADFYQVGGRVDPKGKVSILTRQPLFYYPCPICLAAGTRIATPNGPLAVDQLQPGTLVWTQNRQGEQIARPILKTSAVPVSPEHMVIHVIFADGKELWASPGHPLADGRSLGELTKDATYAGVKVQYVEAVPYRGSATYDVLPAGDTGLYWANDVLLRSTLR